MSSNSLAIINGGELTPMQSAVLAELEADNGGAYDYLPTRIKFPSGGMMAFSVDDTDTLKPPFKAIIAVSQKARAFWPAKDTAGQPPLCSSPDGVQGIFDPNSPQVQAAASMPVRHPAVDTLNPAQAVGPWACGECPMAQWGSSGKGRACKDLRRLIVLVEGWSMPAILTLPPTSVKVFDQFASARARERGQAYFTCYARIELTQETNGAGIKYSVAKLSADRPLTDGELAAVIDVRHQFAELVRTLNIAADDYATDAPQQSSNEPVIDGASVEEPPF